MPDDAQDRAAADDWEASWETHRQQQLTMGLDATPAQRLQWLEEMIVLAYRIGARRASEQR